MEQTTLKLLTGASSDKDIKDNLYACFMELCTEPVLHFKHFNDGLIQTLFSKDHSFYSELTNEQKENILKNLVTLKEKIKNKETKAQFDLAEKRLNTYIKNIDIKFLEKL